MSILYLHTKHSRGSKINRDRYLKNNLKADLKNKMVFIGGPRQVGKTTLSLTLLDTRNTDESHPAYLNWDVLQDRESLLKGELPANQNIIILDEIHKFKQWRNLVKGFYDKHKSHISFVVTGSARLDYYHKGGDSLQGRYHYYRLHPFSLMELDPNPNGDHLQQLLRFGGFPDPLLKGEENYHRRWLRDCSEKVVHQDLRDLELVREISMIDLLLTHLPSCVGSPLSINSIAKLIQSAHQTVEKWICILERLYVCFRIPPFGSKKIRAVKKENKLYFWDWSRVENPGSRFENMVACQLLKYCHFIEDTEGFNMELRYIRDTDKREVDFVVLKDGQPEFAVECKVGEKTTSSACNYFRERTDIPKFYQVHCESKNTGNAESGTRILPFTEFCKELNMP